MIDESPRWLLIKGRKEDAVKILDGAAKSNSTIIYKEVLDNLTVDDDGEGKVSMKDLLKITFKSRLIFIRFIICVYWWIVCCFVTYGIMLNSVELDGNKYLNYGLFALSDIPTSPLSGIALKLMSRKKALFSTFLLAGVLCVARPFVPSCESSISSFSTKLYLFTFNADLVFKHKVLAAFRLETVVNSA